MMLLNSNWVIQKMNTSTQASSVHSNDPYIAKIVATLFYMLQKLGHSADKIQAVKLIYLADKYHLAKYLRTITDDRYIAMEKGPVASMVLDILNENSFKLSEEDILFCGQFIEKDPPYSFRAKKFPSTEILNFLSQTEMEALDWVVGKFGNWNTGQTIEFCHRYPEWKQHESPLGAGKTKSEEIALSELLSKPVEGSDPFPFSEEDLKNAKSLLLGVD